MAADTGPRSPRFPLHLAVWFGAARENQWYAGTTESVSGSGAVICSTEPRREGEIVKVRIELPSLARERGGILIGIGRVVRTFEIAGSARAFAITVRRYRLERHPICSAVSPSC